MMYLSAGSGAICEEAHWLLPISRCPFACGAIRFRFVPTRVPQLLAGLIDDAALLPPSVATMPAALSGHHVHRCAWYADLIGPLLIPASRIGEALQALTPGQQLAIGIIGDAGPAPAGLDRVAAALSAALDDDRGLVEVPQAELAVAMRGEDPEPGLRAVLDLDLAVNRERGSRTTLYAEIPLTWGVLSSLDQLAEARSAGAAVVPKFRTGGLAVELFPTPVELAAVVCACRDRGLPFKLTSAIHRAVRRTDPETGLVNHGFLNILTAVLAADGGAEAVDLAEVLAETDATPLVAAVRDRLDTKRPLLRGLGGCGVFVDTLADLRTLGLLIPSV